MARIQESLQESRRQATRDEGHKLSGWQKSLRWAEYLFAILAGNIIYLLLEPHLPAAIRHQIFRVDWGLGFDLGICVAVYGVIRSVRKLWS